MADVALRSCGRSPERDCVTVLDVIYQPGKPPLRGAGPRCGHGPGLASVAFREG